MEMPSFLQTKDVAAQSGSRFGKLFQDKRRASIITLAVLLLAIPLTVWIAQRTQIFSPKADTAPIQLVSGADSCVVSTDPTNKVSCATFPIKLTSPLGPHATSAGSPSPSPTGSTVASPSPVVSPSAAGSPSPSPSDTVSPSPSSAVSPSPSASPTGLAAGLAAYWKMNETSGTTIQDTSGNNNNGTISANDTFVTGKLNNALSNSGAGGGAIVNFPATSPLNVIGRGQISQAFWLKVSSLARPVRLLNILGCGGWGVEVLPSSASTGMLNLIQFCGTGVSWNAVVPVDNQYHHYVVSYNGVAGTLYKDGTLVSVKDFAPTWAYPNRPLVIGGDTEYPLFGAIDEVGIWNRALTTQEASQLYNSGQGVSLTQSQGGIFPFLASILEQAKNFLPTEVRAVEINPSPSSAASSSLGINPYSGIISYWKLDETSGTTATDFKGANNGTLTGTAAWATAGKINGAFDFNGSNFFNLGDNATLNFPAGGAFTISAWVKTLDTYGPILSFRSSTSGSPIIDLVVGYIGPGVGTGPSEPGRLAGMARDDGQQSFSYPVGAVINDGQWHNVVLTRSSDGVLTLYKDGGSPVVGFVPVRGAITSLSQRAIGSERRWVVDGNFTANEQYLNGSVDEVGVWNRALTPSQITNLYNNGQGLPIDATSASPSPSASASSSPTASSSPVASSSPGASSSPAGSTSPSPSVNLPGTTFYRMAETEAGLETATDIPYNNHPTFTNFTFSNSTPGTKQIWVAFIEPNGNPTVEHISVELVEPDPKITSLDCSMDVSKQSLKLTFKGSRLGTATGKVDVKVAKDASVLTWSDSEVAATANPGGITEGQTFKATLTRADGKALPEVTCQVNTTLVSLGARLFCREPGKFDVSGVKVTLVDENGGKVSEDVSIDADGILKNLKTRLQVGKLYAIAVKAPFSLRRVAQFTAANGTNVITEDDKPFILPVGDIAPVILPDGKINTLDRSEIVRQWSILGTSQKTGDFNRDTKINSIDWACMRYDFNNEDEAIPDRAVAPTPTPSSTPSTSVGSPIASPAASSSPQASVGQRAAYFLLEPVGAGTYHNDDEFVVNVNVWSQNEAANLFSAKLSFDPTALEVSRIEKGTALTSWAEEFSDNTTGKISLTAGLPNPGLKTTEGNDVLMAKVIFKSKKVGSTNINITSDSKIYSNVDNANILTSLLSAQINITQ